MNWYNVFYWLTVADTVRTVCNVIAIASLIGLIACIIGYFTSSAYTSEGIAQGGPDSLYYKGWLVYKKLWARLLTFAFILCIVSTLFNIFIPTKKDMLLIIAGGTVGNFITTDSSSRAIPGEITKYLHMGLQKEIRELSDDAQVEMGLKKPTLADRVKDMTREEIIEYLKTDTTVNR